MFAILRLTTQREAKDAEKVYGGPGGSGVKLLAENLVHLLVSWCLRIAYTDSVRRKEMERGSLQMASFYPRGAFLPVSPKRLPYVTLAKPTATPS